MEKIYRSAGGGVIDIRNKAVERRGHADDKFDYQPPCADDDRSTACLHAISFTVARSSRFDVSIDYASDYDTMHKIMLGKFVRLDEAN
jgi:hypothetical protein